MEIIDLIKEVGSYAGLAAIVGLAVLSALYASQARDVRRLREGAPEPGPPLPAVAPRPAAPQVQRLPGQKPAAAPGVPAPAAGVAAAARTQAAPRPASQVAPPPGAAPTVAKPAAGPARALPPVRVPTRSPAAARTLGTRPPWYRRIAPRYLVLLIAGTVIVGGGAAFGVAALVGGGSEGEVGGAAPADREGPARPPLDPATVTVAVLNGTEVPGLAAQIGDSVEAAGFKRGNITNATQQQYAESVVLYAGEASREARAVAKELDISQIEPMDPESQSLAGSASVAVIVGADQTQ